MDLIFVHGRDQQGKNPQHLQAQWEAALEIGWKELELTRPADLNIVFPFYGDELTRMIQELDAPLIDDVVTKGEAPDTKEAAFRGEFLEELVRNVGLTDADIQSHYPQRPTPKGPLNWEWVQAILKALDEHTPIGETLLDFFTRDVYVYLTNKAVRKVINKIVADKFSGNACVVVGHSLGTVVAYNVLRDLNTQANAQLYVTLGSPLGVKALQRLLVPPALAMPQGVKAWHNAYDKRDVVALSPLDSQIFPITPPVLNRDAVQNHTDNRHGIVGYLDDIEVARWIYTALTS